MYQRLSDRLRAARENEGGFTLIELLIVIVILGILAGIVVFSVQFIQNRGQTAACKTDLKNVQVAAEAYFAQSATSNYPTAIGAAGSTDTSTMVGAGVLKSPPPASDNITYTPNSGTAPTSYTLASTNAGCTL